MGSHADEGGRGKVGRQSDGTRAALLSAAAERFAVDGYARATIQQIAKAAGVTPPTLYAHFGSKEELAKALVESVLSESERQFAIRFPRGLTFEQELELLLAHQFRWAEDRRHVFQFLLRFSPPDVDVDALRRRRLATCEAWLRAHAAREAWLGEPGTQPSLGAYTLDALLVATFYRWMDGGAVPGALVDAAPDLVDTFVGGMRARAAR